MTLPPDYFFFHLLFPPNVYPFTPIGDAVSILFFFNIKSIQYLLRSFFLLAPLNVPSPVYSATDTAFFLLHTSVGLVEPRLLCAATVVLNHRTSFISCKTALNVNLTPWHLWPFSHYPIPLVSSLGHCSTIGTPRC